MDEFMEKKNSVLSTSSMPNCTINSEKKHSILRYVLQMNMNGNDHLPSNFNAVTKWPGKIHEPLDQGNCNASWAFSTAGESQNMTRTTAEEHFRVQ